MKKSKYQSPALEVVYLSGSADVMQGIAIIHHSGGGGFSEDEIG